MTKIISIINQKGGVGKTTTTCSLAAALSRSGHKVLGVDLDPQCNLSQSLGVKSQDDNVYNLLKGNCEFKPISIDENFHLLPSSIDLSAFEVELSNEPGREFSLREAILEIRSDYDYILIDCSPSLGLTSLNALTASDSFLVPILPHHLSIQGLSKLLELTDKIKTRLNNKLELEGILLTQFSPRKVMHRDISEVIKEHFGSKLYKTFIRENIALAEAPSAGIDIFRYAPKSNGAEDYLSLCEEFLSKQY
ncbi:ParA family protein [Labilibaculum sp. DW002]|uniref:ParA family protein n=1 Tax=Paralabilibaculum antarcticum TaxID=2912572 RepID=A0ABT5VST4_9BACT|nr:ParA family protein [Labilibaculum sp. DW002]MDE5418489.1 ParA family protein [Labilibaculum sp. DW002]